MMLEKKRYKQMMMAGNLEGLFALFVKIQRCVCVCECLSSYSWRGLDC